MQHPVPVGNEQLPREPDPRPRAGQGALALEPLDSSARSEDFLAHIAVCEAEQLQQTHLGSSQRNTALRGHRVVCAVSK